MPERPRPGQSESYYQGQLFAKQTYDFLVNGRVQQWLNDGREFTFGFNATGGDA